MSTILCSAPRLRAALKPNIVGAVFSATKLWKTGSTITVSFLNPSYSESGFMWDDVPREILSPEEFVFENDVKNIFINVSPAAAVKKVIEERIAPIVPTLKFEFVLGGADIVVRFDVDGGSSSFIGTDCSLAESYSTTFAWLNVGTIIHEFSHALGMYHEHQNPTSTIKWDKEKLYAYFQQNDGWSRQDVDEQILNSITDDKIDYSFFDPDSVMLYFFSGDLTLDGRGTSQNMRYSSTDIQWLGDSYDVSPDVIAANIKRYGKGSIETSAGMAGAQPARLQTIAAIILFVFFVLTLVFFFK
jgi:Astacin (Peptidase family M12A)